MGYEISVVHPAVEQWLKDQGIKYIHEKRTTAGRIDFLAAVQLDDKSVELWIIECKPSYTYYKRGIMQLLLYGRVEECKDQKVRYFLAMPASEIDKLTPVQRTRMSKMEMEFLPIECISREEYINAHTAEIKQITQL